MTYSLSHCLRGSDEGLAGEFKRSQVGHSDHVPGTGGVENDVQRVEQTVVSENLVLLLEVVGSVQELNLSIELTGVGVKEDLNLVNRCIEVDRMDGSSLDVSALVGGEQILPLGGQGRLSVARGGIEREVTGSGVIDIDGSNLVTGSDQSLDGAHHTVFCVGLHLHGGPVGSDPQLDQCLDGAAIGVNSDLDNFLVGIGELPVLTRHTLDPDASPDVGKVPCIGGGLERGGGPHCRGGVHREGIGGGGKRDEQSGDELHG
mmetsp:Transcript_31124/g.66675  ORF Transcript_31124/g.66675 Transcript_31124/m.66675 type:complete len:260 (-) Transcript_31124:59-838(-)